MLHVISKFLMLKICSKAIWKQIGLRIDRETGLSVFSVLGTLTGQYMETGLASLGRTRPNFTLFFAHALILVPPNVFSHPLDTINLLVKSNMSIGTF